MNTIAHVGQIDGKIEYIDRPTVKVIIKKDNTVLLLNDGLLPGGGKDGKESDREAITRELQEELGVTVRDIEEIGCIIQYRNFIKKRYVINGYVAQIATTGLPTSPQDEGEEKFNQIWLPIGQAIQLVSNSIETAKTKPMDGDAIQSRLYNLITTYELLKRL